MSIVASADGSSVSSEKLPVTDITEEAKN